MDDPNTSERILLDWLTTEGNYSNKWRGKKNNGKKKKHVAAEIALLMNSANVTVKRDHKQVMNKITHIEKAFRAAHDIANTETGQGLQESDKGEFDDAVMKKCRYYFDLLEIFGDRASAKPKVTSADNLDTSEDDEDDESNDESEEEIDDENPESVDLEHMDISFETINDDNYNDTIVEAGPSIIQLKDRTVTTSTGKRSRSKSNISLAGSAASSKRSKTSKISLLNDDANAKLESLTSVQEKLANAKIDVANNQAINQKLQNEQIDLQLRMQKFEMILNIRRQRPDITNEQIVAMFPSLADFVHLI